MYVLVLRYCYTVADKCTFAANGQTLQTNTSSVVQLQENMDLQVKNLAVFEAQTI